MVWQIKPFSHRCHVSGAVFEDGDLYASALTVCENGELLRFDYLAAKEEELSFDGDILCRWRQVYRKEPEKDDATRRQRETAEGLFWSLFEQAENENGDGAEEGEETQSASDPRSEDGGSGPYDEPQAVVLKKFLALLLERKKILRPRGTSPDGKFRLLEHARSKMVFPVPVGEITPDEFLSISERLSELVK